MLLRSLFLVVAGVVLAASSPAQTFNVYEGELENGWQNWSWCSTDLSNADYVRGSDSHSIKATYTAGYQGLYFHYGPFASGYFSALSFYINGGTKAGRSISVAAIVDGNATNSVDLNSYLVGAAKVPAGAWAQVLVPLSDLGVASTDRIEGFWLQESTGSSQQAFWVTDVTWVPTAPPATVHIAVNANGHLQTVSPKVYGLNTAVWDSGFSSAACIGRLQEAHYRSFRFPGGSLSDTYHWKTNTTDQNTW
ncbi:MAG TPA: hypothetical protein VG944_13850, partial [Fimbriimonas sp.]|nr:hypothetical protein [Fimbriimonas sp.]